MRPQSSALGAESQHGRFVLSLIAGAGLCAGAVLAGWALHFAPLKSAGIVGFPMWPLPAVGYIFLALGFWATINRSWLAPWLLAVPLLIAGLALIEAVFGISIGLDKLLFSTQLGESVADHPGRPVGNAVVTLGLLGLALLLVRRETQITSELANLLVTASMCFALFSAVLLLVQPGAEAVDPSIIAPLSCSLIAIALASAFLIWRHEAGWPLLLTDHRVRQPFVGLLLPVIIALPILPSLVQRFGSSEATALTHAEFIGMLCNVAIIGFLLWVAIRRITRQQDVMRELTMALDVAAIAITRSDGTITYWSQGCETLYGLSADDALGQNKHALVGSRTSDGAPVPQSGEAADRELIERGSDGSEIRVIELTRVLDRAHEEPLLVVKTIDISKRFEAEKALRASEAQMRSIIDTMPDAMLVIDIHGRIRTFSAAAERMFGYVGQEMIGRDAACLIPAAAASRHQDWIADYLSSGERRSTGTTVQVTAQHADGSLFPVELSVGETWLGDERVFTGVIRDVTDRLVEKRRISELNTELAHVSRQSAMSELAADLAHELNQPLSATANFLAAARMLTAQGETGERVGELLRMGEEQTLRSGEIIRRLRAFLVKGDVEMRCESVEETVREAANLVFFGAAQLDIGVTYALDPAADTLFGDRIQVQQVLVNLLRNAVQALGAEPIQPQREIVIGSRRLGDKVEISVCNNGPDLPDAVRKQLYSRFTTAKGGSAMGIGLSISRRIVEAHRGTLVAENREEGGVCFRITVPVVEEHPV